MTDWQADKRWSDAYLPEIKAILGQHLITAAPVEEDQERNTDLIVLRIEGVRIACRVRKPGYYEKYGAEFTIRQSRPGGPKTELSKIIEGWGDYLFYAHATDAPPHLRAWGLGDLRIFRRWFAQQLWKHQGRMPGIQKRNNDGSSEFLAFRWAALPPEFLVAQANLPTPNSDTTKK